MEKLSSRKFKTANLKRIFCHDFSSFIYFYSNSTLRVGSKLKMALRLTGVTISNSLKTILFKPIFVVQSTLGQPIRCAARKGYRDKARRLKKLQKVKEAPSKQVIRNRQKYGNIVKTVESKKPDLPNDDIIISDNFKIKKYSIVDAINFHKEYHHPTVFNNPNAGIFMRIEFNMTGKKKTQFIKPFKGIASIPNPFHTNMKRDILVFCHPEHVNLALESGATIAGGLDLVKKIQTGIVQPSLFEYILCHVQFFPELTPIRNLLKTQMPKTKPGTLTLDLKNAILRFLHGVEYACVKIGSSEDFGIIDCQLGTVEMEPEKIEANFKALLKHLSQYRPPRDGDFFTWAWCRSPPSPEIFAIDLNRYLENTKAAEDDEDEEKVEISEKAQINQMLRKLEEKAIEEKILK